MKVCTATLKSLSPYCQSRYHGQEKLNKEAADAYETRTWMYRTHVNDEGHVIIPPMSFKYAIDSAAKRLRMQIPGKGKSEYGKHIAGGVLVMEGVVLPYTRESVPGDWLHLNADGRRGGNTRVMRCIPKIPKWSGKMQFYILDDIITKEVFEEHLRVAGMLVGIGQNRPENLGPHGRFEVVKTEWEVQK